MPGNIWRVPPRPPQRLNRVATLSAATASYTIAGSVTIVPTPASEMLEGRVIAGAVPLALTPAATLLEGRVVAGDVTTSLTPTSSMLEGRVLAGDATISLTPTSAMSKQTEHSIAGDVTASLTPTATMLEGRVVAGGVTAQLTPASAMLEGRVLAGDVTVSLTPASGMSYGIEYSIAGDVTTTLTPASTMLEGRVITGDVTATLTPASTLTEGIVIDGSATVSLTPTSAMVEGRVIAGDATVALTPASDMEYSVAGNYTVAGSVPLTLTPASTMLEGRVISGSVPLALSPAAEMTEGIVISGSVPVALTPAATMLEGRVLAGAVAVALTPAATMLAETLQGITGDVTLTLTPAATMLQGETLAGNVTVVLTPGSGLAHTGQAGGRPGGGSGSYDRARAIAAGIMAEREAEGTWSESLRIRVRVSGYRVDPPIREALGVFLESASTIDFLVGEATRLPYTERAGLLEEAAPAVAVEIAGQRQEAVFLFESVTALELVTAEVGRLTEIETELILLEDTLIEASKLADFRRMDALENKLTRVMNAYFRAQARALAAKLSEINPYWPIQEANFLSVFDSIWLEVTQTNPLAAEVSRQLADAYSSGMQSTAQMVLQQSFDRLFNVQHPRAVAHAEAQAARLVSQVDQGTRDILRQIIIDAVDSGQGWRETERQIKSRFEEFSSTKPQRHIRTRARLVARTESAMAYAEGKHGAIQDMREVGIRIEKYWRTSHDVRVSDGCRTNEGVGWIPDAEAFPSGHMRNPRFPGCRCTVQYRVADD